MAHEWWTSSINSASRYLGRSALGVKSDENHWVSVNKQQTDNTEIRHSEVAT
jgi:hypothetical protein